jgi:hypothetical protein
MLLQSNRQALHGLVTTINCTKRTDKAMVIFTANKKINAEGNLMALHSILQIAFFLKLYYF